jgi:hydrogenase maturation protein HypF
MAVSHLRSAFDAEWQSLPLPLLERIVPSELGMLEQMLEKNLNSPPTSSIGRLFDAVAALVGLRDAAQFEGQAAMELEAVASENCMRSYRFILDDGESIVIDSAPVVRAIVDDIVEGRGIDEIAGAFHNSLAEVIVQAARRVRSMIGVNRVALSGGVFQNTLLAARSEKGLREAGFEVFAQRLVPCNDGGLSLGQAYVVAPREIGDQCA